MNRPLTYAEPMGVEGTFAGGRSMSAAPWEFDPAELVEPKRGNWTDREIVRNARIHGPQRPVAVLCVQALWREWQLRLVRNVRFRSSHNRQALDAYEAMSVADFNTINAAQAWSNWRTIPRNLRGRVANRPWKVIDLCCGTGDSTAVLAFYCPPGSSLLGLEWSENFLSAARRRRYYHASGRGADATFHRQDVLREFCDEQGERVPDRSVDLVHCQGATGSHFDSAALGTLVAECNRVTRSGGLAMLDARRGEGERPIIAAWSSYGYRLVHRAESCPWDRFVQLCFCKA